MPAEHIQVNFTFLDIISLKERKTRFLCDKGELTFVDKGEEWVITKVSIPNLTIKLGLRI